MLLLFYACQSQALRFFLFFSIISSFFIIFIIENLFFFSVDPIHDTKKNYGAILSGKHRWLWNNSFFASNETVQKKRWKKNATLSDIYVSVLLLHRTTKTHFSVMPFMIRKKKTMARFLAANNDDFEGLEKCCRLHMGYLLDKTVREYKQF